MKRYKKTLIAYLAISALCFFIFIIYDQFSHNVRSPYLTYLWLVPFALGVIPAFFFRLSKRSQHPSRLNYNIYNSGVAAIIVGSLLKGVYDIAGTGNIHQFIIFIGGIGITAFATVYYGISKMTSRVIEETNKLTSSY